MIDLSLIPSSRLASIAIQWSWTTNSSLPSSQTKNHCRGSNLSPSRITVEPKITIDFSLPSMVEDQRPKPNHSKITIEVAWVSFAFTCLPESISFPTRSIDVSNWVGVQFVRPKFCLRPMTAWVTAEERSAHLWVHLQNSSQLLDLLAHSCFTQSLSTAPCSYLCFESQIFRSKNRLLVQICY